MISVHRWRDFRIAIISLGFGLAAASAVAQQPGQNFQTGIVLPDVHSIAQPEQTYALYLPSNYSAEHSWPIVYAFDPGARGNNPVELMRAGAQKYGYIIVGSNNSRNGAWKP